MNISEHFEQLSFDRKGRALVVDDHPWVARGMAEYLFTHCLFELVLTASSETECLKHIESHGWPELAVVNFWLPEGAAVPLLRRLAQRNPRMRLLVVCGNEDASVQHKARETGAHGFLSKHESVEVFARAVASLRAGEVWFPRISGTMPLPDAPREFPIHPRKLGLTDRQAEVLSLVLCGQPNKRIARALSLSEQTVKEHVTNILAKLGVANRVEAITRLRTEYPSVTDWP